MRATILSVVSISSIFLSSLCIVFSLNSCNGKKRESEEKNVVTMSQKEEEWLKGKNLCCVDSIVGHRNKVEMLYVFNFYDCMTCVENGFNAVRQIDSIVGDYTVKVIVSMFQEVTSTQRQNEYKGFIYNDSEDRIRKELKYAPTPMLLIVNDSCKIRDAWIFDTSSDNIPNRLDGFVKEYLSSVQSVGEK